jgi:hypothetical protein
MAHEKQQLDFEIERRVNEIGRREEDRNYIHRVISEIDARRDISLAEKLTSMEKLFHAIVSTKADASAIAISRIQGDSKECRNRCDSQVAVFYDCIRDIREKNIRQDMELEVVRDHMMKSEKSLKEFEDEVEKNKEKVDEKLKLFDNWKRDFWVINIPIIVTATATIILLAMKGLSMAYDWFTKLHGTH